jgi:hypothetical protein
VGEPTECIGKDYKRELQTMTKTGRGLFAGMAFAGLLAASALAAQADALTDKLKAGEPIRIGFANEVPWAYPGEGNKPMGFVNARGAREDELRQHRAGRDRLGRGSFPA